MGMYPVGLVIDGSVATTVSTFCIKSKLMPLHYGTDAQSRLHQHVLAVPVRPGPPQQCLVVSIRELSADQHAKSACHNTLFNQVAHTPLTMTCRQIDSAIPAVAHFVEECNDPGKATLPATDPGKDQVTLCTN